jgi:predicted RNA-binding Zn-ribbon protein involved in translation (DUF1610 family)
MGLEGLVSKHRDRPYQAGRSKHWIKNRKHPAMSRLLRGWNVMPTSRNARGIDLLAYDATARQHLGIQVKALQNWNAVGLGKSLEDLMGDWWVIVASIARKPECFIMKPGEVRDAAERDRGGDRAYWLPRNQYERDEFRDAWDRIGRGDDRDATAEASKFRCPTCQMEHKVVRIEAAPTHDNELLCLSCGGPLPSR